MLKLNVIKKQFSSVLSSVLIKEKIYFKVKKDLAVRQSLFLRKLWRKKLISTFIKYIINEKTYNELSISY